MHLRWHALALVAVLATAAPTTAAASQGSMARLPDTKSMVLQLRDLPTGFGVDQGHYVSNAELVETTSTNKDFHKLGRLTGYYTAYSTLAVGGVTAVSSFASVYKLGSGAHQSLVLSLAQAKRQSGFVLGPRAPVRSLGREARLYLQKADQNGVEVDFYTVAWRNGPVFAEVMGAGRSGTVDPVQVVALAKKQDRRIEKTLTS
jgi:hypothetical protein